MSYWICCNSCFLSASADRKLGVTSCGHVICTVCYQKGKQGECLICSTECHVSPLSEKSTSDVKALFSDINTVATKLFTEISQVIIFQARHQKRLLIRYQERNEKLEEVLVKMRHEMQQMTKKLNEQSAYISKLENSIQHQSAKASSMSQMSHSPHPPRGHNPFLQIPFNTATSLPRYSSATNIESMEVDERSLFRKPNTVSRLSLISSPQDGRIGIIPHRSSNHNTQANHPAHSATLSCFQAASATSDISYDQSFSWKSPIFKPHPTFRHSMSFLAGPHH